ncbi:MAG: peptidylprolyl isomerase [Prevotella sp.]|jgi:FKBP-type peptidyl-prolyl cis-trans isomerase SlyD|nr:peptidylprolyl isomerase [Prevotella sp.]
MEKTPNKYIAVAYKLYAESEGKKVMVEEAPAEQPFNFVSGLAITIPEFEKAVVALNKGDEFDFVLDAAHAYGEHVAERVLDLDKKMFYVDGHFDDKNIYKDAIIPLQNEDGNRFMGHVLEVNDTIVKVDLNHPLAGKSLNFKGTVIESREISKEELQEYVNNLNAGGCGGGCDNCGGSCGGEHHHKDGECCGNHKEGECCGGNHHHHKEGGCHCNHHNN